MNSPKHKHLRNLCHFKSLVGHLISNTATTHHGTPNWSYGMLMMVHAYKHCVRCRLLVHIYMANLTVGRAMSLIKMLILTIHNVVSIKKCRYHRITLITLSHVIISVTCMLWQCRNNL